MRVDEKAVNLKWFNELQKVKMMKHPEDPTKMEYMELFRWLQDEVNELHKSLLMESSEEIIFECSDVSNIAYFIADKIRKEM